MAKLKAHGQELLRIEREKHGLDATGLTIWERDTVAYMSDGKVLRKWDVRFKPDQYNPNGRFHSYGWKRWKRIKANAEGGMPGVVSRLLAKLAAKPDSTWKVVQS